MRIDEHVSLGVLVGIILGLHFGPTLVSYMPFIVIAAVLLFYRKIAK